MRLFLLLFLFCQLITSPISAQQKEAKNSSGVILFTVGLTGQQPAGDLSDRFGTSMGVIIELEYISKSNLIFGFGGNLFFSNNVKQDVLSTLRTPEGFIIGNNRAFADVQLRQRGFYTGAYIGKLFSLFENNPRAGLRITLGAGLLQHRIRIQDDPMSFVPQLDETYRKGYDRLTNGLALQQFIGYQFMSTNRLINFHAGIEFVQGFTQSRRDFNFDTRMKEEGSRFDVLTSIRVGWSLPFYLGRSSEDLYY
ncbi:MAG: hypothetical protein AAGG75_18640 [Bacteroidota bacterium]